MWVKGHSKSLKMVLFESGYYFLFALHSYYPLSLAISEVLSVEEWPDLETWV